MDSHECGQRLFELWLELVLAADSEVVFRWKVPEEEEEADEERVLEIAVDEDDAEDTGEALADDMARDLFKARRALDDNSRWSELQLTIWVVISSRMCGGASSPGG